MITNLSCIFFRFPKMLYSPPLFESQTFTQDNSEEVDTLYSPPRSKSRTEYHYFFEEVDHVYCPPTFLLFRNYR